MWLRVLYAVGIWSLVVWGIVLIVQSRRDRRDH